MYYDRHFLIFYLIRDLFFCIGDLFTLIVGGKEGKRYIKQVPFYCRHQCKYDVRLCRDRKNNWKCRKGCHVINKKRYGIPYDWTKPEDWEYYKHKY